MVQAQGIQWRAPGGTVYDPTSSAAAGARISAVTAYTLAVTGLQAGDGGAYRCERKSNQSDYAIGTVQVTGLIRCLLPALSNKMQHPSHIVLWTHLTSATEK